MLILKKWKEWKIWIYKINNNLDNLCLVWWIHNKLDLIEPLNLILINLKKVKKMNHMNQIVTKKKVKLKCLINLDKEVWIKIKCSNKIWNNQWIRIIWEVDLRDMEIRWWCKILILWIKWWCKIKKTLGR